MIRRPAPRRRRSLTFLVVLGMVFTMAGGTLAQAAPTAASELTFTGRGYGHGRGMGQYGALGYAVDHGWDAQRILNHFYQPATLATNAGNPAMTVELVALTGNDTIVAAPSVRVNGVSYGGGAVRVRRAGASLAVDSGAGCAGPWTQVATLGTTASISAPGATAVSEMLRTCRPTGQDDPVYRGTLEVVLKGTVQYTINKVDTQAYLQGVLPREMPASWAGLGSGRGAQALMAQAVAARSYALSGSRPGSGALTCDTTTCQVYGGAGAYTGGEVKTTFVAREDSRATSAVASTNGWVMRMPGGAIARAEFSSSTGGHSAPGTFAAVVDDGDAVSSNPNHTWSVKIPAAEVARALGTGTIAQMTVTKRNGLGADGGRATEVTVTDVNGGTRTFTGAQVRSALGVARIKSDWFTVTGSGPAASSAAALVTALYQDLLRRNPEPAGLTHWTAKLAGGTSQSELVREITASQEYALLRVQAAYRDVLGRTGERAGVDDWVNRVMTGRIAVDDVQLAFYREREFYLRAGGTPERFARHLYQVMLDRPASASEVAMRAAQVSTLGIPRIVNDVWWSPEAARARAARYYPLFLGRTPDAEGVVFWGNYLLQHGEPAVRIGIAGSAEYLAIAIRRAGG